MLEMVPNAFFSCLSCFVASVVMLSILSCPFLSVLAVVPINGHVDLKSSLTPPLITHTAATPMPIPKISGGGDPALGYESRRGSNVSMDPNGQDKPPVSIYISLS